MTLYLLNLADLITTLIALSWGCVEMNPIMAYTMTLHPLAFPAVKIAAYPLCWWLAQKAIRSRAARRRYIALVILFAATVLWNIANIVAIQAT